MVWSAVEREAGCRFYRPHFSREPILRLACHGPPALSSDVAKSPGAAIPCAFASTALLPRCGPRFTDWQIGRFLWIADYSCRECLALQGRRPLRARFGPSTLWPGFRVPEPGSSMNSRRRTRSPGRATARKRSCRLFRIAGTGAGGEGGVHGDGIAATTGGTAAGAPAAIAGVSGSGFGFSN
jgi:hypothetical protein